MADTQKGGTHARLSSIFESGKYFVLAIRCYNRVFTAHMQLSVPGPTSSQQLAMGRFRQ
jgi:hypothetical protein